MDQQRKVIRQSAAEVAAHKAKLLKLAAVPFENDGTDRAMRVSSAVDALEEMGALADLELYVAIHSLILHVVDGARHSVSHKARRAAEVAKDGAYLMAEKARQLGQGRPPTAATARAILPDLLKYRDQLRSLDVRTPNLTSERGPRTVAQWLKGAPSAR